MHAALGIMFARSINNKLKMDLIFQLCLGILVLNNNAFPPVTILWLLAFIVRHTRPRCGPRMRLLSSNIFVSRENGAERVGNTART